MHLQDQKKFNPLNVENWYSVTHDDIIRAGGSGLLNYYNRSHIEALVKLYPELMLKKGKFVKFKGGWKAPQWKSPRKRRRFFDEFAESKGFNPLKAENWYSVLKVDIIGAGGGGLLKYYSGSQVEALVKLYPELMLKKGNFLKPKVKLKLPRWRAPGKQRKFFNEFAQSKKFNPLDVENWYSITLRDIIRAGGSGLLNYYKGSHIEALVKLYPELTFNKGNFSTCKVGWKGPGWKSFGNQRKFFDEFAKSQKFNPLKAENWYSVTLRDITRAGGGGLLKYYSGSHIEALMKLYPELMLNKRKF